MIRVNVVAEGQSEMFFAKGPLNQYFGGMPNIDSRCILTSRDARSNYEYRGGLITYQQAKSDIVTWLQQDPTAYITTMFDFFRLPNSFPEYQNAMRCQNHLDGVRILEDAMWEDINHGERTAPSKRLLAAVDYQKGEAPSEWLAAIGIPTIRKKCPHFSAWLNKLQSLVDE